MCLKGRPDPEFLSTYAFNSPYRYVDPDGRWGIPGAIYGAVAGGTGGYISAGGTVREKLVGTAAGAVVGAIVGSVAPQTSHIAGAAIAGVLASAGGQAAGSAANAALDKGAANVTSSDIKVDAVTTALGALGAGAGAAVGKGISQSTMGPIIGKTLATAGAPTRTGMVAGATVEGAITGGAEKAAAKVKEGWQAVKNFIKD